MVYKLVQHHHSPTSESLTSFQLYLGQSDGGYWVYDWCLHRFREMPCGVKNDPFSVTDPASLDVSVRQDGESVCKLNRSLREFHCLFKVFSTDITSSVNVNGILECGSLCGGTVHIARSQQQNSSDLP